MRAGVASSSQWPRFSVFGAVAPRRACDLPGGRGQRSRAGLSPGRQLSSQVKEPGALWGLVKKSESEAGKNDRPRKIVCPAGSAWPLF